MTEETEQKPYVVILDSGIGKIVYDEVLPKYPEDQFIYFGEPVSRPARANYCPEAPFEALRQISTVIDKINERGYAPEAVIACPFFANALLITSQVNSSCKALTNFAGSVTINCSAWSHDYTERLPTLFPSFPIANIIEFQESWSTDFGAPEHPVKKLRSVVIDTFAAAGIEPLQQVAVGGGDGHTPRNPKELAAG